MPGDHGVAGVGASTRRVEVGWTGEHKRVQLLEGGIVKEKGYAVAGRELSAAALGLDTFRAAALLRPLPPAGQLGPLLVNLAAYCHDKIRLRRIRRQPYQIRALLAR